MRPRSNKPACLVTTEHCLDKAKQIVEVVERAVRMHKLAAVNAAIKPPRDCSKAMATGRPPKRCRN